MRRHRHHSSHPAGMPLFPGEGSGAGASKKSKKSGDYLTYFPGLDAFFATTMDVYSGGTFPPPGAAKRSSSVSVLLTGTFLEASRQRIAAGDSYTHVLICDPAIEVRDGYASFGGGTPTADYVTIPAGVQHCYWQVTFVFITVLPNIGRKKVVLLNRQAVPSSWTDIV
jgi:hypothetical protein